MSQRYVPVHAGAGSQARRGRPPLPNRGRIFARIVENLDGFARLCKSLRYEGTKRMVTRRKT